MREKIWWIFIICAAILFLVLCLSGTSSAVTRYVAENGSANFTMIQDAINISSTGDTIIVTNGSYIENVNVNVTNLSIRSVNGSKSTFIRAKSRSDHVFEVTADYVTISGFTIMNATNRRNAGIYLGSDVDHCIITDSNVLNNHIGISLDASCENTIINNTISYNGYGFYLYRFSNNNNITNNTVFSNEYDGINLRLSCCNNTITNNTVTNNSATYYHAGIHLFKSKDNLIYNNYFNNTNNARDDDGENTWNIRRTLGTNIIGGPYLGGNYWADYTGEDWNGDGLGERPYYSPSVVYSSNGIEQGADYLPLVSCTSPP